MEEVSFFLLIIGGNTQWGLNQKGANFHTGFLANQKGKNVFFM